MRPVESIRSPGPVDRRYHPVALYLALAGKAIAAILWWFAAQRTPAAWCFFAPDIFVLHALFAPAGQGLCRVHTRFATSRREVWLTIDDGPDEHDTPRILDLLDHHGARATFFVVGERADRHPQLIEAIVRRGHGIGHHTHTHPAATFWCATPARLAAELDLTLATLARAGVRPSWFRAPVGIKHLLLHRALARRELTYVGWSIRSGDCWLRAPEALAARVIPALHPGAIILVHEGPAVPAPVRVAGIARLLEELHRAGYTCVLPRADQLR
ncbi:MAG: polysaccharide deacetylase family protein [Opitutaceae bacterium]|nr:polysaccharide deacetylase family protein [Opitutaceae bacterium]